jgi:hypothetical protein
VAGPSAAAPGPASLSFAETADAIGDSDILASVGLGFQSLGLLGDGYAWLVPGLVAGVPGLLLFLLVLGQVVLGVGWLPNAGRLLGPEPPALPDQEHLWWAAGRPIEG